MEKLDKRQLIIITIGLVVVVALGYFRCKPVIATAQELRRVKADQKLENVDIRTRMQGIALLSAKKEKLEAEVGDYYSKIPQNREFADLWDNIAEVMKSHELKDQLIQPNEEVIGEELNSITITIRCSGSFEQLFNFMSDLQKFERVIRIEEYKLTNNLTNPGLVSMDAKAKIYYQFQEQE